MTAYFLVCRVLVRRTATAKFLASSAAGRRARWGGVGGVGGHHIFISPSYEEAGVSEAGPFPMYGPSLHCCVRCQHWQNSLICVDAYKVMPSKFCQRD